MELKAILAGLRRWWALVLVTAVVFTGFGWFVSFGDERSYESRTRILVGPVNTDIDTVRASSHLTRSYRELATSQAVLDAAIDRHDLPLTSGELRAAVEVTADANTRVMVIRARSTSPSVARDLAAAVTSELARLAGGSPERPEGQITLIDPAAPGAPLESRPWILVAIACFAGLAGAVTVVLVIEHFKDAVQSDDDVRALGLDVLGEVHRGLFGAASRVPLVVRALPASRLAGVYRMLATRAVLVDHRQPRILVLPDRRSFGSAEVAANLADVLAETKRVILIDADRQERGVSNLFTGEADTPVAEVDVADLPKAERTAGPNSSVAQPSLRVIAVAGLTGADSDMATELLRSLRASTDSVIVHVSSLEAASDGLLWATTATTTLLVARRWVTRRRDLLELAHAVELAGTKVAGVVIETGRPWLRSILSPPVATGGSRSSRTPEPDRVVADTAATPDDR